MLQCWHTIKWMLSAAWTLLTRSVTSCLCWCLWCYVLPTLLYPSLRALLGPLLVQSSYFSLSVVDDLIRNKLSTKIQSHWAQKTPVEFDWSGDDGSAWSHSAMQRETVLFMFTFDRKHKTCGMCSSASDFLTLKCCNILSAFKVDGITWMIPLQRRCCEKNTAEYYDLYFWPFYSFIRLLLWDLFVSEWMFPLNGGGCYKLWRKWFLAVPEANWVHICTQANILNLWLHLFN